jgi:hypothetical protein
MFRSANVSSVSSAKKSWFPMTQSSFATQSPHQLVHLALANRLRPREAAARRSGTQVTFCVRGVISPLLASSYTMHSTCGWCGSFRTSPSSAMPTMPSVTVAAPRRREHSGALGDRLAACKLVLHPVKTKVVYCKDVRRRGDFPVISFDFLGFQFRARKTMWRKSEKRIFTHRGTVAKLVGIFWRRNRSCDDSRAGTAGYRGSLGIDHHFEPYAGDDKLILERALKLQNYFTQPFFIAEPYIKRNGTTVCLAESPRTCRDILDGRYDDLPTDAFYFSGDMSEIRSNVGRTLSFGPVTVPPRAR